MTGQRNDLFGRMLQVWITWTHSGRVQNTGDIAAVSAGEDLEEHSGKSTGEL